MDGEVKMIRIKNIQKQFQKIFILFYLVQIIV
jgi:delta-aminolevulinic acid dehydratase/porphobilinogen synthase